MGRNETAVTGSSRARTSLRSSPELICSGRDSFLPATSQRVTSAVHLVDVR